MSVLLLQLCHVDKPTRFLYLSSSVPIKFASCNKNDCFSKNGKNETNHPVNDTSDNEEMTEGKNELN